MSEPSLSLSGGGRDTKENKKKYLQHSYSFLVKSILTLQQEIFRGRGH